MRPQQVVQNRNSWQNVQLRTLHSASNNTTRTKMPRARATISPGAKYYIEMDGRYPHSPLSLPSEATVNPPPPSLTPHQSRGNLG